MKYTRIAQIQAVLEAPLPAPDEAAARAARRHQSQLVKPPGALGRLEHIAVWLAAWQGSANPTLERVGALVFAGGHGVARHGVSAYPAEVTRQMIATFEAGGAAINQLARLAGAELRIGDLCPEKPCADISEGPALSEMEFVQAFSYGAETLNQLDRPQLVLLGEMGIGNTTAAAAVSLGLFGGKAEAWVGPGTGVQKEALLQKRRIVAAALDANAESLGGSPLEVLRALGGLELAALAGATLEARLRGIPVLLDGFVVAAAVAPLACARAGALDHALVAHLSAEPGHARLLERLGKSPLLNLNMRLGEASGAAVALLILRAALECHNGMATFATAGVDTAAKGDAEKPPASEGDAPEGQA